ncbi:NAD(P)H-dependent oxidoreductase [Planctomycetaceae bacterium]|jgi:chromate reductase, NAD(P)H dehydrogenase (quinone)|nr:NAD(P)H-dependent oxidoreductase [Planctomycetaceae bacterium]MDC0273847.1 NAD(P)H-dependent oxidoreductase [Planctomycetaceae bacterium]MDC0308270.1 NAD(P)H-dependent oxidoreductase [Planctomycetaceae bacterium]MDG2388263.1 NAD(P)H-dependent oxidoreductase [Planctomycetaceae bacterium]
MTTQPKVLAFAGSARKESWNKKVIQQAARFAEDAGASVTLIDLADFELPLFNEDVESAGVPENARKLKELFVAHDALLIAAPEYNSSITPLLKNTIDWVSRPDENHAMLAAFSGKTAALMSASPGAWGGMRGLVHLRDILGNIGVTLVPAEVSVSKVHNSFDERGNLNDEGTAKRMESVVESLVRMTQSLN